MIQTCLKCGTANRLQSRFCKQCGQMLAAPESSIVPPKKRRVWLGIVWLVVVVLGLGIGAGLMRYRSLGVMIATVMNGSLTARATENSPAATTSSPAPTHNATPSTPAAPSPTPGPLIIPGVGELPHLSDAEEIEIGQQVAQEVEAEFGIDSDVAGGQRVTRIGEQIVPHSDRPNLIYHFTVLATDDVNAFAAPGGFIFVTRGMLAFVDATADDELASVIGHEIGHVALRHAAQRIEGMTLALATLDVLLKRNPDLAKIYHDEQTQIAGKVVGELLLNGWSRNQEFEADHYGIIYMRRVGYDPQAAITLFKRMEQTFEPSNPGAAEKLLATHPPFAERIVRLEQVIPKNEP